MKIKEDCEKLLNSILKHNPDRTSLDVYIAQMEEYIAFSGFTNSQVYGYRNKYTPTVLKSDGVFKEISRIENLSRFNVQLEKSPERIIGDFLDTKTQYMQEKVFNNDLKGVFKVKLTPFSAKRWLHENGFGNMLEPMGSTTNNKRGKLVLYKDGKTVYTSSSEREYKAEFKPKSNSYLLLIYLSKSQGDTYPPNELEKVLREPRAGGESSTPDRRVRDTIQTVRKELGLPKGCDFFLIKNGFGLNCDVEIRN